MKPGLSSRRTKATSGYLATPGFVIVSPSFCHLPLEVERKGKKPAFLSRIASLGCLYVTIPVEVKDERFGIGFMTFTTKCKRCQKVVEFFDVQIGTKIRCPLCNKRMVLQVNTVSWIKWFIIPFCLVVLIVVIFLIVLMVEPGFEDTVKENLTFIKKFFSGSGPPKK